MGAVSTLGVDTTASVEAIQNSPAAKLPGGDDVIDKRLVIQIQVEEDEAAVELLYERCVPELQRYATAILADAHDGEDVAHDTFERALQELGEFDVDKPAPFRAWLRCIARRRCIDMIRRGGRVDIVPFAAVEDMDDASRDDGWIDGPHTPVPDPALVALLKELPSSQHEVLALDCLGFPSHEIASRLGRTPGAVRLLKHRALQTLREQLAAA
jgi:RNA polymerase sigma-70 factor (ECF subfamily)